MNRLFLLLLSATGIALSNPCLDPVYLKLQGLPLAEATLEKVEAFRERDSLCRAHRSVARPEPFAAVLPTSLTDTAAPADAAAAPESLDAIPAKAGTLSLRGPEAVGAQSTPAPTPAPVPAAPASVAETPTSGKSSKRQMRGGFGVMGALGALGAVIGLVSLNNIDDDCEYIFITDILQSEEECREEAEDDRRFARNMTGISVFTALVGFFGLVAAQD